MSALRADAPEDGRWVDEPPGRAGGWLGRCAPGRFAGCGRAPEPVAAGLVPAAPGLDGLVLDGRVAVLPGRCPDVGRALVVGRAAVGRLAVVALDVDGRVLLAVASAS